MSKESKYYKEIITRLERLLKKEYMHLVLIGVQRILMIGLLIFTLLSIVEMVSPQSQFVRTLLFSFFVLISVMSFFVFAALPLLRYFNLFRKETYVDAAQRAGNYFSAIKDDLLNSLQLASVSDEKNFYSLRLIDEAFKNVYNRSKGIKFESVINFNRAKRLLPYFVIILIICVSFLIFIPSLRAASNRLINFDKEFIKPVKISFLVTPGNLELTKGESVTINVKTTGEQPANIFIALKNEDETDFNNQPLKADSNNIYSLHLSSVRNSIKYFIFFEDIKSEQFEITVIDRPIVKTLDLSINPPSYSRLPGVVQKDNGNINALVGTRVKINISSTKELKSAQLELSDSSIINLNVNENLAEGIFNITEDASYKIKLIDTHDNSNSSPIEYNIKALADAYPVIELIEPRTNINLPNDNRAALLVNISDDYGFSKLLIYYRLSASRYEPPQNEFSSIEIGVSKDKTESSINYIWNLTNLSPAVDDVISYYLEVFDNDNISGPKSAKTNILTLRVPSLDEILADADETHSQSEMELQETLKQAEDLQKKLEEIDNELKKDEEKLTWEEKEKIENALEKFQELQEKVEKINEDLSEMKQNLQENNLLSEETMEKYMELQELMDQLTSDEMKKMMEKMQNLLKEMNREMTQDALENMKLDEERFKKSIERTLNLLKRIQVEQKMDELLKRTEELSAEQEKLMEETKNTDQSDSQKNNELSKQQENISDQLEKLEEEMKKLNEKMSELKDMPMDEMQKAMEQMEKQENQELSEQTEQMLQKNQQQMAMKNQNQISENMKSMALSMEELKENMQQQNQVQTFTDMMRIMDNLLELSKQQEELKQQSQNLDPNSSALNELAEKQMSLSDNLKNLLEQMAELSQKTFAISPEMGEALGNANKNMQLSVQSLQNRNGSFAAIQQGESMKHLNEAAAQMKTSMEGMMQSGGQGGMMSLMQQLQQMSGQQMSLNNMTQMLQQMQQGGMGPQQQAELQRLAQQQELIRKSMEQLNKEAQLSGQSKKLPGDLDNILKQMQEVITDMNSQKLDDNLIQKQEKILSKMLDAQRSINERDFEKQRESKTGQTVYRNSPGELNFSDQNSRNKFLDELNRAVKEGYSRDYEELIKKYYEAIQNQELGN